MTESTDTRPGATVSVRVNGESREIPDPCSVERLVAVLGIGDRRIAVAVNHNIVPRSTFASYRLDTNDEIEILEAVGGG